MIRYFSMFSGIGGFEYGIQQSNIEMECVGFCEVDKYAESIYLGHFPNHRNFGDATEIRTEHLPNFDFLVGGFPCQAFSIAGKRRGFDDTRGTLFFEIARILKDKRPKYFLLENVRGLLSHEKGETFHTILEILSDLGYNVKWEVLDSSCFGVPQRRERVFIKGYIRGECGGEILSFRGEDEKDTRRVSNEYWGVRQGRVHNTDEIMNTLCDSGHNGGGSQLIRLNNKHQAQTVYDSSGLACTLSANGGGDGGKTGLYKVDICRKTLKRKYDVDMDKLPEFLREYKSKSGLSYKDIADVTGEKLSTVEHWFRTDEYQSIPSKEMWLPLKKCLFIDSDEFDKYILEFEVVDGKYDMGKRAYKPEGDSPTVTSTPPLIYDDENEKEEY